MSSPSPEQVLEILEAGIRAPSADNRHRVWFEARPGGVSIGADEALLRSNERHRTILALIGVGAIVENILIQACACGFAGRAQFFDDWRSSGLLADIIWTGASDVRDPLAEAIRSRHTNRRFFHGPPVPPGELQLLDAEVTKMHEARLLWLNGAQRKTALQLIRRAESARFGTQALHEELFEAIRFDVGWRDSCDEGLPPGSLEVEPFLRKPFAMLRHWTLMRRLRSVGIHHTLGIRAGYLPARSCSHLGVICTQGEPEPQAPVAGRAFQRLWLEATRLGLALQPLAGAVVLCWGPDKRLSNALRSGWEQTTPGVTPLMLFRLGRARPPSVVTGRKPLGTYLRGAPSRSAREPESGRPASLQ